MARTYANVGKRRRLRKGNTYNPKTKFGRKAERKAIRKYHKI
jgi:hypothetical protein